MGGGGGVGQFSDLRGGGGGGGAGTVYRFKGGVGRGCLEKKKKEEGVDTPMQIMQDVFGQVKELIVA